MTTQVQQELISRASAAGFRSHHAYAAALIEAHCTREPQFSTRELGELIAANVTARMAIRAGVGAEQALRAQMEKVDALIRAGLERWAP